jgi:predicted metal-dependent peptidase
MATRLPITTQALSYLITSQPFIAVLLMELMEIVETDDPAIPHAATDDKHIFLNKHWLTTGGAGGKGLSVHEVAFVIAHEVLHVIYQHLPRAKQYLDRAIGPDFKKFSPKKWNKAADYIINATLHNANIGKMPVIGLHNPNIGSSDVCDEVYMTLPDEDDDENGGNGGNGGDGFDKHLPPSQESQHTNGDIKRATAAAATAAKAQGNMPEAFKRLVGEVLDPVQDWREVLRDFMVTAMGHDKATWSRLNRRKLAVSPHVAFPGTMGHKCGNVAVVVDTSGSISDKELTAFMGEINGIVQEAVPECLKIFWTDSEVAHIDEVDEYDNLSDLKAHGGGGTDMEAAFPVINKEMNDVQCCVVLTDGYTSYHEDKAPGYPVLWCMTTDKEAPYGQNLRLKV